jgi:phosphoglycerol transferase MdoB-like AlkP superfamily enzyme
MTPLIIVADEVRRLPGINWAASTVLLFLALVLLSSRNRSLHLALSCVGTFIVMMNVALAVSFRVQGIAFNPAFFAHLDFSTLNVAFKTETWSVVGLLAYLLAAPALIYVSLHRIEINANRVVRVSIGAVALVLGLLLNYPVDSYVYYSTSTGSATDRLNGELTKLRATGSIQQVFPDEVAKNLVLIYAESLEANYIDSELFPGLTPNLSATAQEGHWFQRVEQYPGTGWTIAGIVSSQCGVPLFSERGGNEILTEVDNPFSEITCLAEHYREIGGQTIYVGGASLSFAGKGNFLRDNGYETVLGIDELPNANSHSWGMYDSEMFGYARQIFDELANGNKPFLLTALTLDTHHPYGTPSPGCTPYTLERSSMLDAVHCSDKLISDFIDHIRNSPVAGQTVIAIVSDHLLIKGDTISTLDLKERHILFLMLLPGAAPMQHLGPSTHFDIGPTLLEAAGLRGREAPFGRSLLSSDVGKVIAQDLSEEDMQAFKVEALLH